MSEEVKEQERGGIVNCFKSIFQQAMLVNLIFLAWKGIKGKRCLPRQAVTRIEINLSEKN